MITGWSLSKPVDLVFFLVRVFSLLVRKIWLLKAMKEDQQCQIRTSIRIRDEGSRSMGTVCQTARVLGGHSLRALKLYSSFRKAPDCHHAARTKHVCHFGTCPPCQQPCNRILACSHICPAPCHTSVLVQVSAPQVARAGPWEAKQVPKMERKKLPCPPCQVSAKALSFFYPFQIDWLLFFRRLKNAWTEFPELFVSHAIFICNHWGFPCLPNDLNFTWL